MKKILLAASAFAIILVACKPDNDTPTPPADTTGTGSLNLPATIVETPISTNPNEVSAQLKVVGAKTVTGAAPAPTGTADSPTLSNLFETEKESVFSGGTVGIPVSTTTSGGGEIKGLFVQVDKASEYLDIPISSLRVRTESGGIGGNPSATTPSLKTTQIQELPIELPANFGIGEFCVTYCVYDANNNVSNFVTKCITVNKLGGSPEFVKNWNLTSLSFQDFDSIGNSLGVVTKSVPGVIYSDTWSTPCNDGTSKQITSSSSITTFNLDLQANGAFKLTQAGSYTGPDFSTSIPLDTIWDLCNSNSITVNDGYTAIGGWSYNETTNKLILVYQKQTVLNITIDVNDAYELTVDSHNSSTMVLVDSNGSTVTPNSDRYTFN